MVLYFPFIFYYQLYYLSRNFSEKKKIDDINGNFIYYAPVCYVNWEPSSMKTEFD